jgi:hypothetical protein
VFGHELPAGRWRYRVTYQGGGDIRLQIKQRNESLSGWKLLVDAHRQARLNELNGELEIRRPGQVKFIFSGDSLLDGLTDIAVNEIEYKCEMTPVW